MTSAAAPSPASSAARPTAIRLRQSLRWGMLGISAVFFALHFVHVTADFPNNSPWMDWSKYTDEGWYGDAAIRHFLLGHWFLAGDFNPAVAMPVWPLLLGGLFHFTGVSLAAARGLTVAVFGVGILALYCLIDRYAVISRPEGPRSLAAPLAVLLLCTSPFLFAFDRLAILEPPLATGTLLVLLTASCLRPWTERPGGGRGVWLRLAPSIGLGLLLAAIVLTKPTAVAIFPAVACLVWHRAGCRLRPALRLALPPALVGAALWLGYYLLLVRPHFLEDYQYLFSANAYTGFQLQPLSLVLFNTVADGRWIGADLYTAFFVLLAALALVRPRFFRNPLVPAFLLWAAGYGAFLAYHNNLQPRYYVLLALPVTALVAMALDEVLQLRAGDSRLVPLLPRLAVTACVLAIAVPDALEQINFLRHPEYTYEAAAQGIARIIRTHPEHPSLLLSVSGSDLTLMTGLPSIDDDFGTLDLDERAAQYRPGWYAAWNQIDDDKMDALRALYRPVRVAAFPALDDPDRNLLILYRLDPIASPGQRRRHSRRTPRPLRTRLGQQPTTTQLQH